MLSNRYRIILALSSILLLSGCGEKEIEVKQQEEQKITKQKDEKALIESYFVDKSEKYNINLKTLKAICKHESKFNPYAINVNKNETAIKKNLVGSYNFKIKEEAQLFMNVVFDKPNISFDVGYCQINNQHFSKNNLESEDLLDIETNIEMSAKIYRYGVDKCSKTYKEGTKELVECSLSMYNTGKMSKNSKIGKEYANKVILVKNSL